MLIATIGIVSNGLPGNKRGVGSATLESPEYSAKKSERQAVQSDKGTGRKFGPIVLNELLGRDRPLPESDVAEGEAEEREIETVFRRKLAGLRHVRKSERAGALKAARDWRTLALKALRKRRASKRYATWVSRQLRRPVPC